MAVITSNTLLCVGDEISAPDGDPYEAYRILFDLTFFFFVIVILLAIIQGKYQFCVAFRTQHLFHMSTYSR